MSTRFVVLKLQSRRLHLRFISFQIKSSFFVDVYTKYMKKEIFFLTKKRFFGIETKATPLLILQCGLHCNELKQILIFNFFDTFPLEK